MLTHEEWANYFRHLPSRRISRLRLALKILLDDKMYASVELVIMDAGAAYIQRERKAERKAKKEAERKAKEAMGL